MTILSGNYDCRCPYTVADLLNGHEPIDLVMVRTNDPYGGDTLFGYCRWDGGWLQSLDGENYLMDETVIKYEWPSCEPVGLIYWIHSEWLKGE